MTLIEKVLKIDEFMHEDGGMGVLKLRWAFENIEQKAAEGDARAIEFALGLDRVYRLCELVMNTK